MKAAVTCMYVKGSLVANEIWWNIWGWVKNEGLKGEGGYKEKGNDDTIIITQMWNISKIYTMDRKINYTFQ